MERGHRSTSMVSKCADLTELGRFIQGSEKNKQDWVQSIGMLHISCILRVRDNWLKHKAGVVVD